LTSLTLPLRDRGFISDQRTGALVAADGTLDWYCPGQFDRPADLFGLLDPAGGAVRIGPGAGAGAAGSGGIAGQQSYVPDTNVLRTVVGDVELLDFMPGNGATGRIVRIVSARRPTDVVVEVVPGHAFGPARRVHAFSSGMAFDGLVVQTGFPIEGRRGVVRLDAGERVVVTIDTAAANHDPLTVTAALDLAALTEEHWRRQVAASTYDGPYAAAVRRSLLVLKGLTYAPTGAIVAAPTTSLPERVGGERNWDYRYTWLRDASRAVEAMVACGLDEAGEKFVDWLGRVLDPAEFPLAPVYDVEGGPVPEEHDLPLAGWRRSQPVRVGNAASSQLQLDFYADVVAVVEAVGVHDLWPPLARMADWLAGEWDQPDRGMWEIRCEPRHLVSSKLGCWYALSRLAELGVRINGPLDLSAAGWRETAREVLAWIEEHGMAADGGLRHDDRVEDHPDASLLAVAWKGPWPASERTVVKTVERVLAQLSDGPFVYRYPAAADDGLPAGEGAFVPCSFWAVRALAALGRWDEAHSRMEQLVAFAGPLGLLPEEADPLSGDFLGNLPQAWSHLSLVNAALALTAGPR
jgi:GH15 family glucan-1,4-alpha-glucosidase